MRSSANLDGVGCKGGSYESTNGRGGRWGEGGGLEVKDGLLYVARVAKDCGSGDRARVVGKMGCVAAVV